MTFVRAFCQKMSARLSEEGVEDSALEVRRLLEARAGLIPTALVSMDVLPLSSHVMARVEQDVARRIQGEPLSRILGVKEFYGLKFKVTPDVLDPRPETEHLVDHALRFIKERGLSAPRILDLGTGSGCILIALLHAIPTAQGVGVDLSPAALAVACENARARGVIDRTRFLEGNWAESLAESFDVVVSNPPYIRSDVIPTLDSSVKDFDPPLALDGGADGLQAYSAILKRLKRILDCGGRAFFEIGFDQATELARLVENSDATLLACHKDYSGNNRVFELALGKK